MAYEIYDKTSSLSFPNGKTYSPDELKGKPFYAPMFSEDFIIDKNDNGVVTSIMPLSSMKNTFGITTEDPIQALNECIEAEKKAIENSKIEQVTIESIDAKADENTQAIAELGVMTADGQTTNAELLQAVGELGVQVAELSAKIEQLQTPTA